MSVQSSAHPVASVLSVVVHDANVLLVRRINPPDAGKWGYPGGWVDPILAAFRTARAPT
ncbi:NUDIX domain-containing protein [Devosia ginsengisoli]|uniref:NUDIX domain-containing protein n=1 Tax=Devosia ginsengisoli TaxID=400770 RepID=UPI00319DD548